MSEMVGAVTLGTGVGSDLEFASARVVLPAFV